MPRAKASKPKGDAFTTYVSAIAAKADPSELSTTLGKLVSARLRKRSVAEVARQLRREAGPRSDTWGTEAALDASLARSVTKRRRARRIGRAKPYTPTTKVDISRLGTFRHYMIQTIRKHSNTADAEREHNECDNPKFSKNRLDFNWAADNGFIIWA